MKLKLLGIFFITSILVSISAKADSLVRKYKIDADFQSYENRKISANIEVNLANRGAHSLREIWFILYPNRFKKPLPNLNDVNYRLIYPRGFSSGEIVLEKVLLEGRPIPLTPISHPNLPQETLFRLVLPNELNPGKEIKVSIQYKLLIPQKYGSFGIYRRLLSLAGGWYPYVVSYQEGVGFLPQALPERSDWELSLNLNTNVLIGGSYHSDSNHVFTYAAKGVREMSLMMGKCLKRHILYGRQLRVELITSNCGKKSVLAPIEELVVRWLEFVEKYPELISKSESVILAEAPLRDALVAKAEGFSFFSDRAFKLISLLAQYHTTPLIRALFYQLIVSHSSQVETSESYDWVAEVVAWFWTQKFVKENRYQHIDARTLAPMRLFSFLPSIDRVIYSPQFAFYDVFYDFIYPYDASRDDPLHFSHDRPYGRTIYAQMEDVLGEKKVAEIAHAYTRLKNKPFIELTQELTEQSPVQSIEERFLQWTSPRPLVNYHLKEHRIKKDQNGFEHEVLVHRESEQKIVEPVELGVTTKGGERLGFIWDGQGNEHLFQFRTRKPVKTLEIDPRHRLWETKLSDNRKPPKYKLVFTDFVIDYDFNANQPQGFVLTQFRKAYGGNNRYNFSGSFFKDTYGVGVGYTRLFGRLLDRLRLSHALSVGFDFDRFNDDLALGKQPNSTTTSVEEVGSSGYNTSLGLSYSFGNQISFTNPLDGGGAGISARWGTKYLGGEFDYYRFSIGGSWIVRFHPYHLLALRGFLGLSGPNDIPSQVQYLLGGIGGIRGIDFDDDRFKGRNILLTSAEYRHFLLDDIDLNLWLFRIRDVQGALFGDAGRVTDTVQEKADQLGFGATTSKTDFDDLFGLTSLSTDLGYGIRLLVDYMGVNPGLLRFDAAKSLSEWKSSVRFYFGVTQSF